ncbi:hypothetical protein OPV22_026495 [Ensete ventricosum]|uniref:Uncharacterized protein n=1 Tax=Ensete ventricosum TaxID=4639 RepID=A0AAV8QI84_ENSVE|nr:hypothetical protein OPV22_026495 [Ensete ventricosum]
MWRSPEKVWDARDVSPARTPSRAPRRLGPASRFRDGDLRRISSVCRCHASRIYPSFLGASHERKGGPLPHPPGTLSVLPLTKRQE